MDYKKEAIEYLKNYDNLQTALDNLKDEILELKIDIKSIKANPCSDMPHGGGTITDDALVNKILRLSRAEIEYKQTQGTLRRIDQAFKRFESKNNSYAKILRGYFIDCLTEEQLAQDLNISDRHLRRVKQQAIKTFAIAVFGVKVIA